MKCKLVGTMRTCRCFMTVSVAEENVLNEKLFVIATCKTDDDFIDIRYGNKTQTLSLIKCYATNDKYQLIEEIEKL